MSFSFSSIKQPRKYNTMIINIYGGPGIGKSTIAAGLFNLMNVTYEGFTSVELVTEYAKDLIWENRLTTLQNQFYIDAK